MEGGAVEEQLDSELHGLRQATVASLATFAETSTLKPESRELTQTIQGHMAEMRAKTRDLELLAEEQDTYVHFTCKGCHTETAHAVQQTCRQQAVHSVACKASVSERSCSGCTVLP